MNTEERQWHRFFVNLSDHLSQIERMIRTMSNELTNLTTAVNAAITQLGADQSTITGLQNQLTTAQTNLAAEQASEQALADQLNAALPAPAVAPSASPVVNA
jgi:cell division FtsZ-interacting protein ZapD